MATLTVGTGEEFSTLAAAVAASHNGDVIDVQAGTYTNDFATITTNITIQGVGGMVNLVATQSPPNGKAILTTDADVTLDHIAFSGASVPDGNGAGIRYETGNLTIENCYFHDNQEGLLGGNSAGTVTVINSEFAHNGAGDGQTHNIYVGEIGTLQIENSYFHDAIVGHEIKSRADNTIIENTRIFDNATGTASYSIDLPDGGNALIKNDIIEKGPQAENDAVIHFGGETATPYANSSLQITGDTVLNDLGPQAVALNNQTNITASLTNDQLFGFSPSHVSEGPTMQAGNTALAAEPTLDTSSPWASSFAPVPPTDNSSPTPSPPPQPTSGPGEPDPGHWAALANTEMSSIAYNGPLVAEIAAVTGPQSVIGAWGGAAFDTKADQLILWGGGHENYAGNEVYAFNLDTLQWSLLDQPSSLAGYNGSGILSDGTPVSRHTYGGMTYLPNVDQVFAEGGADWPTGGYDTHTWGFDPHTGTWSRGSDAPSSGYGNIAAYDPTTGHVWLETAGTHGFLSEYNPLTKTWIAHGTENSTPLSIYASGAIDPIDHELVAVGHGQIAVWDLNASRNIDYTTPVTTGDASLEQVNSPGFVWDSKANLFVGWGGGTTIYTLDPKTWHWETHTAVVDGGAAPPEPAGTGTFGRFQYVPSKDEFVLVNDINQDVYLYKPDFTGNVNETTAPLPAPSPTATPSATPSPIATVPEPPASPPPVPIPTPTPSPPLGGSLGDGTITVHVSGDAWQGDPRFIVTVDGREIGGIQDVSANHSLHEFQDITITGSFDSNPHDVAISFINDGLGPEPGQDRNIYVDQVAVDGVPHSIWAPNVTYNVEGIHTFAASWMYWDGSLDFHIGPNTGGQPSSPPPTSPPIATVPQPQSAPGATAPPTPPIGDQGHTLMVGAGKEFATLADAIAAARDGDVIQVQAGTYVNDFAEVSHKITIEGVGGMANFVATVEPYNHKAILVADTDVTIENLSFSGAHVSDGNGAGIRYQGGHLTIEHALFFNNQDGLLGGAVSGGSISISNSQFDHNGAGDGFTHNLYVGEIAQLTVENSLFENAVVGHEVKSRADNTLIENSVIADGAQGTASYDIDLPDGGHSIIRNNVIEKGPQAQNDTIIHFGGETATPYANSSLEITGNTIVSDMPSAMALRNQTGITATFSDNQLFGLSAGHVASGSASQSANNDLAQEPEIDTSSPWATPANEESSTVMPVPSVEPVTGIAADNAATTAHIISFQVSGDQFEGDPQVIFSVDGHGVGGTQSVSAVHSNGEWQTLTINGNFANPQSIGIDFINDAGGSTGDRNVYVQSLLVDGHTFSAANAINDAGDGSPVLGSPVAHMYVEGWLTFNVGSPVDTPLELRHQVLPGGDGTATGTAGDDDLYATAAGQTLIGDGGNDIFNIGNFAQTKIVATGPSITQVTTSAATYVLPDGIDNIQAVGTNSHVLIGNANNNVFYGSNANDTFFGGSGNAKFEFGTGANTATGASGDNTYVFSAAADHDNVITNFHQGLDVLDLRPLFAAIGYAGADPVADHHLIIGQNAAGDAILSISSDGDPAHAHALVTLLHVTATDLHVGTDFIWHG